MPIVASTPGAEVISTDDPVRMYLMQMGEIPMLSRAEEIAAADRKSPSADIATTSWLPT